MTQDENKIMMENLPPGSMKSDVENVLNGWISGITISKIDLLDKSIKRQKCKTAFVALSSYSEVEEILDFYNANFGEQGFAFEDGFANLGMVRVKKYTGKTKLKHEHTTKEKPLSNLEILPSFNQNRETLFTPTIEERWDTEEAWNSNDEINAPNVADDKHKIIMDCDNSSSKTIMFQRLPQKTTRKEIEELINQFRPTTTKIINIDVIKNNRHKFKWNAFVQLQLQSDCNDIVNTFKEIYGEKGYFFVNQENHSSTFHLVLYSGKKKDVKEKPQLKQKSIKDFHIYLEKVPPQTTKDEIYSTLDNWLPSTISVSNVAYCNDEKLYFVKLPSWDACDTILTYFKETFKSHGGYAFQNAKGRYNLIQVKRNESFYLQSCGQNSKPSDNLNVSDLKCTSVSSCIETNKDSCVSPTFSMSNSNEWNESADATQIEEMHCHQSNSISSSFSQPSQISGGSIDPYLPPPLVVNQQEQKPQLAEIILEDDIVQKLNTLMHEKEELEAFRKDVMVLEDELKTKCPDLFVSEVDLMLLREEIDKMKTKKNELLTLKSKAKSEYDELKEQLECLNEEGDV